MSVSEHWNRFCAWFDEVARGRTLLYPASTYTALALQQIAAEDDTSQVQLVLLGSPAADARDIRDELTDEFTPAQAAAIRSHIDRREIELLEHLRARGVLL